MVRDLETIPITINTIITLENWKKLIIHHSSNFLTNILSGKIQILFEMRMGTISSHDIWSYRSSIQNIYFPTYANKLRVGLSLNQELTSKSIRKFEYKG